MFKKLLNTQTKSISWASLILMGSYLTSAFLGIFRDRLLAGQFGAGHELDVYYTAFTLPDLIALILIFGAISAAIIPIFSSYWVKSKEDAWQYISTFLNVFFSVLIGISIILIIFAPILISFIAPGFSEEKKELTVMLMRIMFLCPIILGASNIISGILQVFHKFLVTALAPILYNLGIIAGIIFFVPWFGIKGLAYGVVFGALLHLAVQIPSFLHSGFSWRPNFNIKHPGVLKTLKLMAPRSLGLGASQLNTIVITAIASTLATGSVAIFNLSSHLSSLLINAFAVSLSTAIFPSLSLAYSIDDKKAFQYKFSSALKQILFVIVPAGILIFILRAQIVRVILGTGKFGWIDTRLTAACLGIFSFSLLAQGLVFILSKTFYAGHNTKIPAIASTVTVGLNIAISLLLVNLLNAKGAFFEFMQSFLRLEGIGNISITGLAMAFTLTAIFQAIALLFFVYKKFELSHVLSRKFILKILYAALAMTLVTFFVRQFLVEINAVRLETFLGVFSQLVLSALIGGAVYVLISYRLNSEELKTITRSFFNAKSK